MHTAIRKLALAAMIGAFAPGGSVHAELQPGQVFVVYNRNLPESRGLAEYYLQRRGIPATQSIGLDLPNTDEITREAYLAKVRAPLRGWLRHEKLQEKIRCVVTMYGVPLRIVGTGVVASDKPVLKEVAAELDSGTAGLQGLVAALAKFAAQSQPASQPAEKVDVTKLLAQYTALRDKAVQRMAPPMSPEETDRLTIELKDLLQRGEGLEAIAANLRAGTAAAQQTLASFQASLAERRKQIKGLLRDCPGGPRRQEVHAALREQFGLRTLIEHLQEDKTHLEGKETHAALDSELSLLWWEEYPLSRWVLNPLCWRLRHAPEFAGAIDEKQMAQPVVMVARLDAPAPPIVRRMIDDAIAVEEVGLSGKVYIDARGIKASESGYGQYDEDLRQMARLLGQTPLSLVVDDMTELFGVGQCTDAALYCGWYSLGKYVDAFHWNRGAVAYHVASSEAVSLHNPKAQYWCKRMLEEGVAATLGPVAEPYLHSFPRPRDFFGLLLTGRYTLAEVYWHTCPLASWMQMLLGDPLYMPYKKRPLLRVDDVLPAEWITAATSQPAPRASAGMTASDTTGQER